MVYLVTIIFLFLKNTPLVTRPLCPFSLYSPHSLTMSHTITSVSCNTNTTVICNITFKYDEQNAQYLICITIKLSASSKLGFYLQLQGNKLPIFNFFNLLQLALLLRGISLMYGKKVIYFHVYLILDFPKTYRNALSIKMSMST